MIIGGVALLILLFECIILQPLGAPRSSPSNVTNGLGVPTGVIEHGHTGNRQFLLHQPSHEWKIETVTPFWF